MLKVFIISEVFNVLVLADHTNGRAYATAYYLSICHLSVTLWLNGASLSKSYYWQPIRSHVWEID